MNRNTYTRQNQTRSGTTFPSGDVPPISIGGSGGTTFPSGDVPPIEVQPPTVLPPIGVLPPRPEPPVSTPGLNNVLFRMCFNRLTYVWDNYGESYWTFPTHIENNSVYGYRWKDNAGWFGYIMPLNQIRFLICTN